MLVLMLGQKAIYPCHFFVVCATLSECKFKKDKDFTQFTSEIYKSCTELAVNKYPWTDEMNEKRLIHDPCLGTTDLAVKKRDLVTVHKIIIFSC